MDSAKKLKGNINHSACRWCYSSIPLEEFCQSAKKIGLVGIDLVGPKDWDMLKFENGSAGVLMASQVAAGEENALKIRVYGEKGGIEWAQHEPNTMLVKWLDQPTQIYRAGGNYADRLSSFAVHNSRTPGGHPEGYLEAFANIYRNFSLTLGTRIDGTTPTAEMLDFPGVEDGIRGMAFIDNVVLSSQSSTKWTPSRPIRCNRMQ